MILVSLHPSQTAFADLLPTVTLELGQYNSKCMWLVPIQNNFQHVCVCLGQDIPDVCC